MDFIAENKVAVLATVTPDNEPTAALVYYLFKPDNEFFFITKESSRKYSNLMHNKRAGIVIGTMDQPITVQMQGSAELFTDALELPKMREKMLRIANGGSGAWPAVLRLPGNEPPVVLRITIDWMQLYDGRNLIHLGPEENKEAFTTIIP